MLFRTIRPATILNAKAGIVWLRVLSSLAWIDSAFIGTDAKIHPAFWHGGALADRISSTFVHTAIDSRVAHLLVTFVAPHAALFGSAIALADTLIGVSLVLGIGTRAGAALAIVRSLTNIAVAGGAGVDTIGFNAMLIAAAAICIGTAAGRKFGLDRGLIDRYPTSQVLRAIA